MTAATFQRRLGTLFAAACVVLSLALLTNAQTPAQKSPALNDIAISPSRLELVMAPGAEKTVVVNLIYTSDTSQGQPTRVIAYLGDWSITKAGKIEFFQAGSRANSASSWLVYSPTEVTVMPGKTHSIRVTVSVPKDATPGEHITALFVEPRPDDNKTDQSRKQVRVKFRLAAIFYVMVPTLMQDAGLENLKAESNQNEIIITPLLNNKGNTHVRPIYSIKLVDQSGATVVDYPETESLPVLAGSETEIPVLIDKAFPPGAYSVQYRVKFSDNGPVTEGRATVVVSNHTLEKGAANSASKLGRTKPLKNGDN